MSNEFTHDVKPVSRVAAGLVLTLSMLTNLPSGAQTTSPDTNRDGSLFDNVVRQLEENYYDEVFRRERLPVLVERYRPLAEQAKTLQEQRQVAQDLLADIPASHMGLLSRISYERLTGELQNQPAPTFGFELVEYDGKHYAHSVLEGGPAARAGLNPGDRILLIDGELVDESPRLDWRTDDAYLPDPPMRGLLCNAGETVVFTVEQHWGEARPVEITAENYSMYEAARVSARVIEHDGRRFGYVHFWVIHMSGVASLVTEHLNSDFADCDGLILDLRGRGGSGGAIPGLLRAIRGDGSQWRGPVVALINRHSRSAKEVISYELRERELARLVGERTAGAVIPATFADVGHDTFLMFPQFKLGEHTDHLEGVGVEPHVQVEEARPYSAGRDPILEAGLREAARLATDWVEPDGGEQEAEAAVAIVEDLPVAELLDRMVEALGGEDAIRGHRFQTVTGTLDMAGMMQGPIEIIAAAPDLQVTTVTFEGFGSLRTGYNGEIAWRDDPQRGPAIMEGAERRQMIEQSAMYGNIDLRQRFETIESAGVVTFADRRCYELAMTDAEGTQQRLYIDASTFLPAGRRSMQPMPMGGEAEVTVVNLEYREFDGVMVPVRVRQTVGDMQEMTITFDNVTFTPMPRSAFDLPESITALLASN